MDASITYKMSKPGADTYYDEGFRRVLEDHLPILIGNSQVLEVEDYDAYKYEGVLFDYLEKMGYSHYMHWVIMRASDMETPTEFDKRTKSLIIPDQGKIDELMSIYRTSRNIRR